MQLRAIDELNVPPLAKFDRSVREASRRHNEATGRSICCHDAVEFPHNIDANLQSLPLLALDKELLVLLPEDKVDSAVRRTAAPFDNLKAFHSIGFPNEQFEVAPTEVLESIGRVALRSIGEKVLPRLAAPCRDTCGDEAQRWKKILAKRMRMAGLMRTLFSSLNIDFQTIALASMRLRMEVAGYRF